MVFFAFLFQNWESEGASRAQAGVWSRCEEKRKHLHHDCQGHEILACLNALSSNELKNRSFVVLTAIRQAQWNPPAPTCLLSVLFQHGLYGDTKATKTGSTRTLLPVAQPGLGSSCAAVGGWRAQKLRAGW